MPYPNSGDAPDGPAAALELAEAVTEALENGHRLVAVVRFTASGTFSKASYPYLSAIRVRAVGGGGGGGGCSSGGSGGAAAGGGGAGAYAESLITDIAGLAASVAVTVGAGGAGGAAGGNGTAGGVSSFGTAVVAGGGGGGTGSARSASSAEPPGAGGVATAGDLQCGGSPADTPRILSSAIVSFSNGAPSVFGGAGLAANNGNGSDATAPGAGGGGSTSVSAINRTGGDGADGLVEVEVYA